MSLSPTRRASKACRNRRQARAFWQRAETVFCGAILGTVGLAFTALLACSMHYHAMQIAGL